MLDLALSGNTTALKFCLERLSPRLKSRRLDIEMPPINTPAALSDAVTAIVETTARGEIDVDQARTLTTLLDTKRKCLEAVDLEERLTLIEKKVSRDRRAI